MINKKILDTKSVSGLTGEMTRLLEKELSGCFDSMETDALGSVVFSKKAGAGKKLMLSCGIDTAGLIATYAEGTKISVSSLGSFHVGNLAFGRVCFEKLSGVLVPSGAYSFDTPITDYVVETFDKKAKDKIQLGDTAYFDEGIKCHGGKLYTGFASGAKMSIAFTAELFKKLVGEGDRFLKENGIGELYAAFLGQESLGSRGASSTASGINPDYIIHVCPMDMTEKNVGSFDFSDGVAVKMLDRAFVAAPEALSLCETMLKELGVKNKRRVSNNSYSALKNLGLCDKGAFVCEIGIPVKFTGTRAELVSDPFRA